MNTIKLSINGKEVEVAEGATVLDAAKALGIEIPTLCHHPSLKPSGQCRVCAVEIEGQRGLPEACATPAVDGMVVMTATDRVMEFRREVLSGILAEHPRECPGCDSNQNCELQNLIEGLGIDRPYVAPTVKEKEVLADNPFFRRDYNLCIKCGRCVRMCHEFRGASVVVMKEVEGIQEVGTPLDLPLPEAGCQFCAACVDVCPVGALALLPREFEAEAQEIGSSLPGNQARFLKDFYRGGARKEIVKSICPYCGVGCQMIFEKQDGRIVQVLPDPEGPANLGQACVKGRFGIAEFVQHPGRLTKPLIRENGEFRDAEWDEALDLVAEKLKGYKPEEIGVVASAKVTNEENYVIMKLTRGLLRTNSIDHCARL